MYDTCIMTICRDTKSIKEAIELVQTEDELQWFIALSDVSVTTLIMNWKTSTNKDHNALVFEVCIYIIDLFMIIAAACAIASKDMYHMYVNTGTGSFEKN